MRIIKLTEKDYNYLIFSLGMLTAERDSKEIRELSDWILAQGNPANYTYFHKKEGLVARKNNELDAEANPGRND